MSSDKLDRKRRSEIDISDDSADELPPVKIRKSESSPNFAKFLTDKLKNILNWLTPESLKNYMIDIKRSFNQVAATSLGMGIEDDIKNNGIEDDDDEIAVIAVQNGTTGVRSRAVNDQRHISLPSVNPSSKPIITGTKPYYAPEDLVNVTCVSAPSRPAAILKWWINGEEARTNRLPSVESPDGLFTSLLTLKFIAKPNNFWEGKMKLQCEAIISQAHTLRSEEIIISNNGATIATGAYDQQKDGPSIDGGKHVYNVGDLVDINCTAAPSQPPAELHWYINDKEVRQDHLIPRKSLIYQNGEESPVLGLRFEVKQRHFQKQEMRLRCTATLSEVKRMTSEPLEAVLSEQQKSDLHVDLNISSVSNKSTWSPYTIHPLCCLILLLVSRTFF